MGNENVKRILILDDSPQILAEISLLLHRWGYEPITAQNPQDARTAVETGVNFAIVDLFLDGARGDELSEQFIDEVLFPRSIPFGRLTSAPEFVPAHQQGFWILHKYDVRNRPELLRLALEEVLATASEP